MFDAEVEAMEANDRKAHAAKFTATSRWQGEIAQAHSAALRLDYVERVGVLQLKRIAWRRVLATTRPCHAGTRCVGGTQKLHS